MSDDETIERALSILESRVRSTSDFMCTNSSDVSDFLRLKIGDSERELFCVLFLTVRHQLIAFEEMFAGTIDKSHVHVREIAKRALQLNASAVVLAHNHPSNVAEPSTSDIGITNRIKEGLDIFDVRVLDHVIVCCGATVSLASRGLL